MKLSFESASLLKPRSIDLKNHLLELYIKLPWFLGRNNKQSLRLINDLKKISFMESALADLIIDMELYHINSFKN